jgi:dihydroorotate dehydrogenase (NAD+) catalytic subunit
MQSHHKSIMATMQKNLHTSFCGMSLNSPIVLLSGCVGFGEEYTRIKGFSNSDIGAVCLKGTTLDARLGNKLHRIAETPMECLMLSAFKTLEHKR